jgi:predicted DNA binding CopG/RHH family protein
MKDKLTNEEKDLLSSYENDEWNEVDDVAEEIEKHKRYASNTFKKDKRINIRISQKDLDEIQVKAMEEGLPYQTLISSLIHKYISGKLVDKNHIIH